MKRRNLLQGVGVVAAAAATRGWSAAGAKAKAKAEPGADAPRPRGMAHALTVLNFRRNGQYRLGVKTDDWVWVTAGMGQRLFSPPSVASYWSPQPTLNPSTPSGPVH